MNVIKNGIVIGDGTFRKMEHPKVNVRKKGNGNCCDRYDEMWHKLFKEHTVVTPFDRLYINQLKHESYKVVDDL